MNPKNEIKQGDPHTGAFGITGGGKTTAIKRMIKASKRLAVWDVMEDIGQKDKRPFIHPVDRKAMLSAFKSCYRGKPMRIAYQPEKKNRDKLFHDFCRNLMSFQQLYYDAYKKGNHKPELVLDVVIDELDTVYPRHVGFDHPFSELVRRGRHYGIRLIGATQFPTTVNSDFRRNCSISYLFPLGAEGPSFVQSAYKNKQASDLIKTLPNHSAIVLETGAPEPWIYQNPPLKNG